MEAKILDMETVALNNHYRLQIATGEKKINHLEIIRSIGEVCEELFEKSENDPESPYAVVWHRQAKHLMIAKGIIDLMVRTKRNLEKLNVE